MSADTGWSLQILFLDYKLSCRIAEDESTLTAWEPLAIHPQVKANGTLMGLGSF